MSSNVKEDTNTISLAMDRTGQCVFPEDLPSDILVQVGETKFPLHKIMLLGKSNYIRRLILESKEPDLGNIDLSDIPGGAEIFEKVATFCYGNDIEITLDNVVALHCAAEYLEMTDEYCDGNLASHTYDFLTQVALKSLSGAITVLKSCEYLLPIAGELVHPCVEVAGTKACEEANFPSRSQPNWWTEELSTVNITFFQKIMHSMKSRGAKPLAITGAITTYAKRWFPHFFHDNGVKSMISDDSSKSRAIQRKVLDTIVSLMPDENQQSLFTTNFLCRLLNTAIFLEIGDNCKKQLETRISATLDHVTVNDLLILSYTFDGERVCDLESVRRIVTGFVEKDKSVTVFDSGDFNQAPSPAMLRVVKTVDEYLSEIAKAAELSISKFNGIANLVPKNVRQVDDDLYRAIDIYLQVHPNLDEIQKEKVCSVMDPLKLSTEARLHASQNKRFPLQIVLHSLYYDQLQVRSGQSTPGAQSMRLQVHADVALAKENENLRSELLRMKMYISDMEKDKVGTSSSKLKSMKKPSFFSSMSKKLGKLNPFKQGSKDGTYFTGVIPFTKKKGSKDTSNIDDGLCHTTPRRRRFSMS